MKKFFMMSGPSYERVAIFEFLTMMGAAVLSATSRFLAAVYNANSHVHSFLMNVVRGRPVLAHRDGFAHFTTSRAVPAGADQGNRMKKSELLARIVELEKQVAQLKLQQDIDRASRPVYVPPLGYTPTWPFVSPVTCEPIDWWLKGCPVSVQPDPNVTTTSTSPPSGGYATFKCVSTLPTEREKVVARLRGN